MATFFKWYLASLKSHPLLTNMGSAMVMMTSGDMVAQEMEFAASVADRAASQSDSNEEHGVRRTSRQQQKDVFAADPTATGAVVHHGNSYGFFYQRECHDKNTNEKCRPEWEVSNHDHGVTIQEFRTTREVLKAREEHNQDTVDNVPDIHHVLYPSDESPQNFVDWLVHSVTKSLNAKEESNDEYFHDRNQHRHHELDLFRSGMMAGWAMFLLTPFYVTLFRWYEKNLPPGRTLAGVASRVGMSFVTSVPVNLAFFAYGCMAHHTADWATLVAEHYKEEELRHILLLEEQRTEVKEDETGRKGMLAPLSSFTPQMAMLATSSSRNDLPHFNWEEAWSKIRNKWESEMLYTTQTSASFWIPFNSVNFSLVPVHLRPVTQCAAGVGWNCFLSLAQHR
uniref:Uncharacterized protein n=1 Tax=Entomoneis paludosa TaxID=265537 RepID=A0A7S2Y9B5_9STRA|mmetsp:Transcript_23523/g.48845  ORF Transcript_23523/g.48845 Transcript_23523/m.48845 type:complete len:395 (+) Transcript_23523:314-1498(+)